MEDDKKGAAAAGGAGGSTGGGGGGSGLSSSSSSSSSLSLMAEALFGCLLEELCLDLVLESHHHFYFEKHKKSRPKMDVFGNYPKNTSEYFKCVHCQQRVVSSKFAPHLDKCMGRGGRQRSSKRH
eukprot:CAMPEP_0170166728 /NCGR_PEP_ID=MMETSP0040_2-20121228/335_1 /TAXON_ID=641309 /ORGANISM="Lotharella oceanica, Strain CCMP622" /LENGTH=124 /DNA_ID=CAMNT_0010404533 /DNA_START=109 /DNA_END=483 /DNA_ORIENTATION=+